MYSLFQTDFSRLSIPFQSLLVVLLSIMPISPFEIDSPNLIDHLFCMPVVGIELEHLGIQIVGVSPAGRDGRCIGILREKYVCHYQQIGYLVLLDRTLVPMNSLLGIRFTPHFLLDNRSLYQFNFFSGHQRRNDIRYLASHVKKVPAGCKGDQKR